MGRIDCFFDNMYYNGYDFEDIIALKTTRLLKCRSRFGTNTCCGIRLCKKCHSLQYKLCFAYHVKNNVSK